eukprot:gnl/TRDRNA2_/TRDRNA2_152396_c0_seq1.p1 gnl/TRDRNA2_/TRDRNA2_152396_c0~~gnl/TRDRNA2_/TRDRNA2_152396_c0_seq1.p1  ORF type:complete len:198 (-),score=45.14 gnl/TRDRNA2_/TRDRNA2_152396_c0_seq1:132-725(-)
MAAAYRSLHLGPLLAGGGSDGDHWQCTGALPAILGELLGEQGNDGAGVGDDANAIAARAIQDFVFLSSFARLCGGNDQAPKRDPLPNRRITAARSKAKMESVDAGDKGEPSESPKKLPSMNGKVAKGKAGNDMPSMPAGKGGKASEAKGSKGGKSAPADPGVRFFKKHICQYWERGTCQKGSKCTFAHGAHELAPRS